MDKKDNKREFALLITGALISFITAFATNFLNAKREDRRFNIQKKLELNDQLSKDLGRREYFTFDLYRKKRDKDSTLPFTESQFRQSIEEWNLKIFSYESLLTYYYGQSVRDEFIENIYNPLIDLGIKARYNRFDSTFENKYTRLNEKTISFTSNLFELAQ